jgi:hypothetical protein
VQEFKKELKREPLQIEFKLGHLVAGWLAFMGLWDDAVDRSVVRHRQRNGRKEILVLNAHNWPSWLVLVPTPPKGYSVSLTRRLASSRRVIHVAIASNLAIAACKYVLVNCVFPTRVHIN